MPDLLQIHKALADETRLRLVRLLVRSPLNVNEILAILQMGQSRVSRHLRILAEAGLVTRRREGTWIYYERAAEPASALVADTLRLLGEHERALAHYDGDLQRLEAAVERRREQTRRFFDGVTDAVALDHRSLDGTYYRQVALALLPEQCGAILDLGTGSGLLLPALLERAERVIAVDASMTMLDLARQSAGAEADRCDFRLGDLEHLPVADGEVDAAVACMVLHHVSAPSQALAETWRALSAGGQVAIVDLARHDEESLREQLADLWLGFEPAQIRRWLRQARFEAIHAETVAPQSAASGADDFRALELITFRGRKPWARSRPPAGARATGPGATAAKRGARAAAATTTA